MTWTKDGGRRSRATMVHEALRYGRDHRREYLHSLMALLSEWRTPPFEPIIQGENLFARGASDDAPNEKLYLPTFYRGIETLSHYFSKLAAAREAAS